MTLTTLVIVALAIVVSLAVGHAHPVPDRVAMLHLDVCKPPCWIGITPGVTTVDEAIKRTREVYPETKYKLLREGSTLIIEDLSKHDRFTLFVRDSQSVIYGIEIFIDFPADNYTLITIGELIAKWGDPLYITLVSCEGHLEILYPSAFMQVYTSERTPKNFLDMHSFVAIIDLIAGKAEFGNDSVIRQWQGFAAISKYFPICY